MGGIAQCFSIYLRRGEESEENNSELDWFSLHLGAHQPAGSNSLLRYLLRNSGWPAAFVLVSPVFLGFAGSETV